MDQASPLELILRVMTTDGIAYFADDSGNEYFHPSDGQPIRPLIHGQDDHPMMYQFSQIHPLAESGRRFATAAEADRYVGAIEDFDRMLQLTSAAYQTESQEIQKRAEDLAVQMQEKIKQESLSLLDTIPAFTRLRKYLDMTPEAIYTDMQTILAYKP